MMISLFDLLDGQKMMRIILSLLKKMKIKLSVWMIIKMMTYTLKNTENMIKRNNNKLVVNVAGIILY